MRRREVIAALGAALAAPVAGQTQTPLPRRLVDSCTRGARRWRASALLHLIRPISRVAVLRDPTTGASQVAASEKGGSGVESGIGILSRNGCRATSAGFRRSEGPENAEALNVFSSPFLASLSSQIIQLAAEYRLPTIYQWREHVEAGGLVSYGPSLATMFRQAAIMVSRSQGPVRQPYPSSNQRGLSW